MKPLAMSMGDPAGIGIDVTLGAWIERKAQRLPAFVVCGDPENLEQRARILGMDVPVLPISDVDETAATFDRALPVLPLAGSVVSSPGQFAKTDAALVLEALDTAIDLAAATKVAAIVTNPVNKAALYAAGFDARGHTDYLGEKLGVASDRPPPVMLLTVPRLDPPLRVVPTTVHEPLSAVPHLLSVELIVKTAQTLARALEQDFDIENPRLAVAALNPHGGEQGALGQEEIAIIAPAVATLVAQGIDVSGPLPADSLFHDAARQQFDAVLCMYHDQALIPLKALDFFGGVNVTLGLPIIRTSPDHGTAYDLAGTGKADPTSMIEALKLAGEIARRREVL